MTKSFRWYAIAVAAAAGLTLRFVGWRLPDGDATAHWNALVAFVVLCFLSEASYLNVRVGRAQTSSSVAFIPFIASFILFDAGWAALVAGTAVLAVDFAVRKKAAIRILFNTSQMTLSVAVAALMYQSIGGDPSLEQFHIAPVAVTLAAATYFFVNSTLVSVAVSLGDGVRLTDAWLRISGASLVYDIFSSPLGPLLAFLYVKLQLAGMLVLILPIYFVRHIYHVNLQLEQVNRDLLELMVKAIEARDPYTSGHSLRVSRIATQIARDIGLSHKLVEQISTAALLHDVGKIHEDFAPLLRKEGKLDQTEKALMQTHPTRSAELVATISAFRGGIELAVRHHHENFDGSGYPMGLVGQAIPIGARIVMIADTIDAMTTDRPYRFALSYERVIAELERLGGKQFDPELVRVVVKSSAVRSLVVARVTLQAARQDDSGIPVLDVLTQAPTRPQRGQRWVAGGKGRADVEAHL